MNTMARRRPGGRARRAALLGAALALLAAGVPAPATDPAPDDTSPPTLEETRLALEKWIETQQIISRERKDWQQGREILQGRLELVQTEVAALEEQIAATRTGIAEADRKRAELLDEDARLRDDGAQLTAAVDGLEAEVRRLLAQVPEPVKARLQPLHERMPADAAAKARVAVAERFQNVLGILNELNKANNEIAVNYEVRTLSDGKLAEVRVLYVGLAQAWYVSARGEAGIGRASPDGWTWQPADAIAGEVLQALEIIQGKQPPAFVPLPVTLQ
jgi:septal ring factor EnvC (AmiA/AmiB activator)